MSVFLSPVGGAGAQFFDNNGDPLTGGKLYTYAAGTTTPQATYTSSAGNTFHTNPIVLDAVGRVPGSSEIWLADTQIYKFVLKTSDDVLLATWDQINGVNSNLINFIAETEVQTATAGQTVFALTTMSYQPGTNSLTVYVDGINQYEGIDYTETDSTTVTFNSGVTLGSLVKFTTTVQITGNATNASVVVYDPPFVGGVPTTVENKLSEFVSVTDFGASPTATATQNLAAFQAAAAASQVVYIPAGTYQVNGTITISLQGSHWFGDGIGASVIQSTVNNLSVFSISPGLNGVTLQSFKITRTPVALSNADGITCKAGSIGQANLINLLVEKHYNGLSLGPTDWSNVNNVISQKNENVGFYLTNTPTDGACQWSFDTCLAQMNGQQGFLVESQNTGPTQISLGTFKNCATFANSGVGIAFQGQAAIPVQGVRINGGFFGQDGNHEIYLDTHGYQHMISDVFVELAGTHVTGPSLSAPASNIGNGIHIETSNDSVLLTNIHSWGNSFNGFYLGGLAHSLSNCRAINNGAANVASEKNGVKIAAGRSTNIVGGRFGAEGGITVQDYGVATYDGVVTSIGFAVFEGNAIAPWTAGTNLTYLTTIGNLPNTLNVQLSPQGAVLVGGNATGGFVSAGTINVAGGLFKNNTAYTNP